MGKPILAPGRPGDLVMIVEHALETLKRLERDDPGNARVVHGTAIATYEAIAMWLGFREVATEPPDA